MAKNLTSTELRKIYELLKAFDEGLIINPSEDWELDSYDESLVDRKGLKLILKKIEKLLPEEEVEEPKKNILRRRYDTFNNQIDEKGYSKIEKAFDERKIVEKGYFNMGSAEVKKREIDIYPKTRKYIISYCHLRKAMRKFRTSRVVSAKITNKNYIIPKNFDKNKY